MEETKPVTPKSEKLESDSPSTSTGSKRKRSTKAEKLELVDTPNKRQRNPVKLFQSPAEVDKTITKVAKSTTPAKEEVKLIYKKGLFLALRGDDESFFLCRVNQNVCAGTSKSRKFSLNWLTEDANNPNTYKLDYLDKADIDSILTNIRMDRVAKDTFALPDEERKRIEMVLNKTLKYVAGDLVDEEIDEPDQEEEEEKVNNKSEDDESCEEEPPAKKRKGGGSPKKATPKAKSAAQKKKEKEQEKKRKVKEQKEKKSKLKGPDRNLKPIAKVKVLEKDPFFDEKSTAPFVSVAIQSKQVFAAIASGNLEYLKELIENDNVYKLDMTRSPGMPETPLEFALKKESVDLIEPLVIDVLSHKCAKRLEKGPPVTLMQSTSTGEYNPIYLGIGTIRALNVSRGSREGNNAFAKDKQTIEENYEFYIGKAIEMGVKPETFDLFVNALVKATSLKDENNRDEIMEHCFRNIHSAIENGHKELASYLVSEAVRVGGYGYNFLHEEVLKFKNEDLKTQIQAASVKKKPYDNRGITPLHCAAINPNDKFLKQLLSIEPDINLMDRSHKRPVHYAAVCTGSKPLEFLLSKGASITDADTQGNLPLHRACALGRAQNVSLLLEHAKTQGGDAMATEKWGVGGINRGNRNSYCPIHLAVMNGHMDVVKVLVKYDANVNKQVSASKNKLTPLMMAAERGDLGMARYLVQSGASVEQLDKLKRSALTHAVINGNTNVVSYFLYLGADPNRKDSSGNSLVHYAAAYGWYHCLKLLIKDAGAKYDVNNDWKTTPLAIAFLKGHTGIVDFLLNLPDTDINFKDEKGMTLVSIAASSRLLEGLEEQITYLVKEKKADPTITDLDGYTALHHLCANNVKLKGTKWSPSICEKAMATSVKVAHILLDAGCDVSQTTNVGKTPVSLALDQVNSKLVQLLVQQGGEVPTEKNEEEKNALHIMAEQCCTASMQELVHILAGMGDTPAAGDQKNVSASGEEKMEVDGSGDATAAPQPSEGRQSLKDALKKMAAETDFLGFTPLLRACHVYRSYVVPRHPEANQVEKEQENGRRFIKALIEVAGADVSASVKEKNIPDAKIPTYTSEGKYTATHMMVHCQTEIPVKEGDVEIKHPGLALILQYRPNLELQNLEGYTPLIMATKDKQAEKIRMLIEKGADPNATFNHGTENCKRFITPCLWLAMCKELSLVRMFLRHGANPQIVDPLNNNNIMHFLANERSSEAEVVELMKYLLDKGLRINDKTSDKNTVLHIAVTSNSGDSNDSLAVEEFLLSQGADVFAKNTHGEMPIHCVFERCAKDPIELLSLLTTAMNDQRVDEPDARGNTPLHLAASRGATICCMHLFQRRADVNKKNGDDNTPLTLAVKNSHDSCAIMLLQQGASVKDEIVIVYNPKPQDAKPAENAPSTKKEMPVVKWRPLQQQQEKDPVKSRITHTVFQGAISSELQGVAHLLLERLGRGFLAVEAALNVNKFNVALRLLKRVVDNQQLGLVNKENQTLFHVLAIKTKAGAHEDLQLQVAQVLIERGVPVDVTDNQGCTAVQYCAIYHQPVQLAKLLIENSKNFDPKTKDKMGRDLVAAVMWDYEWVSSATSKAMAWVDLLIEKGLSLDTLFDRPLPDILLFGARLDSQCPDYFTTKGPEAVSPLILAIRHYNFGLARYLLKKGANPNFRDSMGLSPLMHAVKMNDLAMVRLLMDYDYIYDKEGVAANIVGSRQEKPVLVKKYSRNIFLIKTNKRTEEMEKDPSVEDDAGQDDSNEDNMEEGIEEELEEAAEEAQEEEEEEADVGVTMNGELEGEEEEEDSDHDTDIVEDEEEEEPEPPAPAEAAPPRLGSKQKSLVKRSTAELNENKLVPKVNKTSNVDLNQKDPQGMTVFHHAVFSLDFGTFDNADLIRILYSAGADFRLKDVKGEMPKDSALMRGAARIAETLTSLDGPVEKASYADFTVVDGVLGDGSKPDYTSDADSYLRTIDTDDKGEPVNAKPKVDSNCEMRVTGDYACREVYHDESRDVTYDVTLTKVDVAAGPWGMYNFYKMQIVRQKAKDMYVLFTRWGRIGDRGQWQHTPFPTAQDAVKEFCKIFRQKTGNDWNYLDKFEAQKKKYRLMPKFTGPTKSKEIKFNLESPLPTKVNPLVLDLLQELTNVNMLQASAKCKGLDEEILAFGRISRCNLDSAKDILLNLEKVIAEVDQFEKNKTTGSSEKYQDNCEKIASLTNEFYHLVPVGGFEYDAIRPIRSKKVLKEHFHLVSDLMDMEVASKILLGSQFKLTEMNPMDYIYRSIGCKVQPLTENEIETQYILTYINASGHGCKVNAVYKVARPGEAEALETRKLHNHRLLWHGSSMANIVSILSRGLLVSPAGAPKTGNLFGEGVYFADCFTKSRSYCYNAVGSCKVMLLCEVALGNSFEDFHHDEEDHHDEEVHSLKILGKMAPDSDFDVALPYGATIPLGQLKTMRYEGKTPYVQYNEYIVHDPKQICIRYIVMFDG